MNDLDALVRSAAIGITLLLTAVFLRAGPNRACAWIGAPLAYCRFRARPPYLGVASFGQNKRHLRNYS